MKIFNWSIVKIGILLTCMEADCIGQTAANAPKGMLDALERARANERPIEFYGKVVDQFDVPVQGAKIFAHIEKAMIIYLPSPEPRIEMMSDSNGRFETSDSQIGLGLIIDNIEKDGYGPMRNVWPSEGCYRFDATSPSRFHADKTKPEVFSMRKKTRPPAFLFQETDLKLEWRIAASGRTNGHDFIKRHRFDDANRLVFNGAPVFPDIKLKATFNTNDGTWTVVLSPGNTNGGIIASEQMLYEAPETGYQPEYVFAPEDRPQQVKMPHLYLKSREPAIYTRIDIKYINANKEFFRLSGESVTNPYGERNLEMAPDLPYEVAKPLIDEVKAAFRQNKRPSPPDLPKLIKEAKEKTGGK